MRQEKPIKEEEKKKMREEKHTVCVRGMGVKAIKEINL